MTTKAIHSSPYCFSLYWSNRNENRTNWTGENWDHPHKWDSLNQFCSSSPEPVLRPQVKEERSCALQQMCSVVEWTELWCVYMVAHWFFQETTCNHSMEYVHVWTQGLCTGAKLLTGCHRICTRIKKCTCGSSPVPAWPLVSPGFEHRTQEEDVPSAYHESLFSGRRWGWGEVLDIRSYYPAEQHRETGSHCRKTKAGAHGTWAAELQMFC